MTDDLARQYQADELMELRDQLAEVYERIRSALRSPPLHGVDLILYHFPIKSPFLEMYDGLTSMAAAIRKGEWEPQ